MIKKILSMIAFVMLLPFDWFHMVIIWQNYDSCPKFFQKLIDNINE